MATITCRRCQASTEQMPGPPMGGPLGETIVTSICPDCWQGWRETSRLFINHYGLVLGDPHHRQQLRQAMLEFLNLTVA